MNNKKIICFILCIAILLSYAVFAFAESGRSTYDSEKGLVVALGDSIFAGTGTDDDSILVYGLRNCEWSAPYLVAKESGLNFAPLAFSGMRTTDYRAIVEPGLEAVYTSADSNNMLYLSYQFSSRYQRNVTVEEIQNFYLSYIEKASVILLDVGTSDVLNHAVKTAESVLSDALEAFKEPEEAEDEFDYRQFDFYYPNFLPYPLADDPETFGSFEYYDFAALQASYAAIDWSLLSDGSDTSDILSTLTVAEANGILNEVVTAFVDAYNQGMQEFKDNYVGILEGIKRVNPDAELIVVGFFNPYRSLILAEDCPIPLGRITEKTVYEENAFVKSLQAKYGFKYVDVKDIELCSDTDLISSGIIEDFDLYVYMAHPTKYGHRQMADRILEAINEGKSIAQKPYDVSDYSRYNNAVIKAVADGLVDNIAGDYYLPYFYVSRATLAEALYRCSGCPDISSEWTEPFVDVYKGCQHYDAIVWAYNNGLISGASAHFFGSSLPIRSNDAEAALYKAFNYLPELGLRFTRAELADVLSEARI